MYSATEPSLVTRVAFFAATETPFLRRTTTASSRLPLASVRACLQSIIGAPVFSRSSFTWAAEIFGIVVLIKNLRLQCFRVSRFQGGLGASDLEALLQNSTRAPCDRAGQILFWG